MKAVKRHVCKIVPLDKQSWFKNMNKETIKGLMMMSQHLSNIQVFGTEDGEYFSVANPGQRGGIAKESANAKIFDIAYNPRGEAEEKMLKYGYLAIIREKIQNDLEVYRRLLESMNISDKKWDITLDDVAEFLKRK
jgi:hypothetical protein